MWRKRRGWPGAAARVHGRPDVVTTMWIVLVLTGTLGGVICYPPWGAAPVPPEPVQVMADVTNHLGVALLQDFATQPGNVAFSPYGAASVLIVLWEGAKGESGEQLRKALGLPTSSHPSMLDHGVIRLGMRDIHRHLRSYFAHDGYLNGLTFGNTSVTSIKSTFKDILRFYGYDPDTAMSGGAGVGEELTTPPWMKKPIPGTTPIPTTTREENATNPSMEPKTDEDQKPTSSSTPQMSTAKKPVAILPTIPPTTAIPILTPSTPATVKPSKTSKSVKTTVEKQSVPTTEKMTPAPTKPTSKPASGSSGKPPTKITKPPNSRVTVTTASTKPTLQDFNSPAVLAFTDSADATESTRVTRKMMSGDTGNILSIPISTTMESSEPISVPGTRASFMPTMFSEDDYDASAEIESSLASMNQKRTTPSGITTTFVLMTMTTKKLQQLMTNATPITNLQITDNQTIPDATTPMPVVTSTPQPEVLESTDDGAANEFLATTEKQSAMSIPATTSESVDVTEATTIMAMPMTETDEPVTVDSGMRESEENPILTTTPEYESITQYEMELTTEGYTTMGSDIDVMIPTPEAISENDPTESVESAMVTTTETTGVTEEIKSESLNEGNPSKSRKKRFSDGENNFPEIQLHLHGNAMLSQDEKDLDKLWQNYQGQFGLPLAPFNVKQGQGYDSGIKWVPMIRLVRLLPFAYSSRLQAQALMLPLDDERYKLLLILPVGGDSDGFNGGWRPSRRKRSYPFQHQNGQQDELLLRLIEDLRSVPLREIVSSVQPCMVAATIPPFLIRGLLDLTPSLERIGVKDVFSSKTADLSGMSNDTNLWVRGVEQTVSVAIDVNGLFGGEGASYSGRRVEYGEHRGQMDWSQQQPNPSDHPYQRKRDTGGRYWGGPSEEPRVEGHFMATRPFLFFVVDTSTRVALMAGKVTDPLSTRNA